MTAAVFTGRNLIAGRWQPGHAATFESLNPARNKDVVGGVARDFYRRIKQHYDKPQSWVHQKPEDYDQYRKNEDTMWVFEPRVAEKTYDDWMKELDIPVTHLSGEPARVAAG